MKIAVIDYDCGNLYSLVGSLRHLGYDPCITRDADIIRRSDRIILPGVGAFADAKAKLDATGMTDTICSSAADGTPVLGICLGMQMLFDRSYEYGVHPGLSLISGEVRPLSEVLPHGLKIPHMGWNSLRYIKADDPICASTPEGTDVYFVHSYYAVRCDDALVAVADYGVPVPAIVRHNNVVGMQFHPEKSGEKGLTLLRSFITQSEV